ncbi:hypothetical protein RIF29_23926 [Crotalaria pallida]|uniref:Uncharacterized protein n=1 Tax=Crotalaria pallida TaxID=3830 RepID=A0AAN9HW35_CROPI
MQWASSRAILQCFCVASADEGAAENVASGDAYGTMMVNCLNLLKVHTNFLDTSLPYFSVVIFVLDNLNSAIGCGKLKIDEYLSGVEIEDQTRSRKGKSQILGTTHFGAAEYKQNPENVIGGGWHKWKGLVSLKHVVAGSSRTRDACEWNKPYWEHRPRKGPTVVRGISHPVTRVNNPENVAGKFTFFK